MRTNKYAIALISKNRNYLCEIWCYCKTKKESRELISKLPKYKHLQKFIVEKPDILSFFYSKVIDNS